MSVKKVSLHVATEVRDTIRSLAKNEGVSIPDFIETHKKLIEQSNDDISSLIVGATVKSTPNSSRHTVKVLESTRSFIKKISEKYNVPMSIVISAMIYKVTNNDVLGNYLNVKTFKNSKEKNHSDFNKTEKEKSIKNDSINSKGSFVHKSNDEQYEAREKAQARGKYHQNIANMSVEEIHFLAKNGDKRAQEIINRRDQLLAKEEERSKKRAEKIKLEEKNKVIRKEGDALVNVFKREVAMIKKGENNDNIKTIIREILVKDVDFHEEQDNLSDIRNKLDELIGKLDIIKPYSTNTSYQLVNESKNTINTILVMLNRYCSIRTRLYISRQKEELEKAS